MIKTIALICCRGGSKGIPGKNIKHFHGKPLLNWIIESAKESSVFDEIFLSTDSSEIAEIGRGLGISIPGLRPSTLAADDSDQFDTHKYLFEHLKIKDDSHFVCNLNNNPFISSEIIRAGFHIAHENKFENIVLDYVEVASDYKYFRQSINNGKNFVSLFPLNLLESNINRQSAFATYSAINNMRWAKPSHLISYENFKMEIIRNGYFGVKLPKMRNFDLDDLEDWEIAEAVMGKLVESSKV